jgi:tetratricopeptide (TPR) repeat protein
MKYKLLLFLCLIHACAFAQKQKADSLARLLAVEKTDTGKVKLMWQQAGVINVYNPDSALVISQQALVLATQIKYIEGQSRALGTMAYIFNILGNYPKALELNLRRLALEEKGTNSRNLAMTLLNIGIVYRYQEDYDEALRYYYRSDSVTRSSNIEEVKYYVYMNLGDAYDKMGNTDSAFNYFNRSLILSNNLKNDDYIGNSLTGLGHTYSKQKNTAFALLNYTSAIDHLVRADNSDVLCEAMLGLANLYKHQLNKNDSAAYYATLSLGIARKAGILPKELEAANFLNKHYGELHNIDSAYAYLVKTQQLNDSVNSRSKIRELQVMSSNEKIRQMEIEENKRIAKKERRQQLQLLFIGIFIPGFFLLTLLLSRIRIHTRIIKVLGILSLLFLFEYLTLLLHPTVAVLTNHTPVLEMLIFVSIAAVLIPGHHRVEQWLIEKLTNRDGSIRLKKFRMKVKEPVQ